MNEFRNYIYLDMNRNEVCTIEHWNITRGTIAVRYANGKLKSYNDFIRPHRMRIIGRLNDLFENHNYLSMNKKDRELFKNKLEGLAQLVIKTNLL